MMLNDTWEEDYETYIEGNPSTLCGGVSGIPSYSEKSIIDCSL